MIEPAGARFAVPLVAVLAVSVLVSLLEGVPQQLPGVALGSDVLLHIERVSAIFAIVVAVLSVLHEATGGRLPTQLTTSGLAYEAGGQAARATEKLQRQFDDLYTQGAGSRETRPYRRGLTGVELVSHGEASDAERPSRRGSGLDPRFRRADSQASRRGAPRGGGASSHIRAATPPEAFQALRLSSAGRTRRATVSSIVSLRYGSSSAAARSR